MVRIRRLGIIRTSNTAAMVYLLLTLVILLIAWAFVSAIGPSSVTDPTTGRTMIFELGIVAVIALPFLYAIIGWLFTALFCVFYNLAAALTGGVEMDLVDERSVAPPATSYVPPSAEPPSTYAG
jgi:hypothetical protein